MKWRSALLAAVLLALAAPLFAAEGTGQLDDCIFVRIGDVTARPGENIMVPIVISETTGWGIMAFQGQICWCDLPAGLLQFEACHPGDVVNNSGWRMGECGFCGPNCINFAAAHFQPLVGAGTLFYLEFHVSANAKPCMCCAIRWDHLYLYDPEQPLNVCLDGGEVCIEHCDVYGTVKAWFCDYDCGRMYWYVPLPDARVHLSQCGQAIATTYTNSEGRFAFECLWPPCDDQLESDCCDYCVEIDYCRAPDKSITAFDAALILQYLVCYDDLDCCWFYNCGYDIYPQRIAADVNCTGAITAYDASLILQYIVRLIPAFPCPDPWVWYRTPCGGCLMTCSPDTRVGIIGVLKGNVSGKPQVFATLAPTATVKLGVPQHFDGYGSVKQRIVSAIDFTHASIT